MSAPLDGGRTWRDACFPAAALVLASTGPGRAWLLGAGALLLVLAWPATSRAARIFALLGLALRCAGAFDAAWPRAPLDSGAAQARARFESQATDLTRAARAVAGMADGPALAGEPAALARLFGDLERLRAGRRLELALRSPSLVPLAWAGRPAELDAHGDALDAHPGLRVSVGPLTTTLVAVASVRAPDGRVTAVATAETVLASRLEARTRFAPGFDRLTDGLPGLRARYHDLRASPDGDAAGGDVDTLRAEDGRVLVSLQARPPPAAAETAPGPAAERRLASLALAAALALWGFVGRPALGARALATSVALRVLVMQLGPPWPGAGDALLSPAVYASPRLGPLLRSPLDLLLSLALLTHAGLALLARLARAPVPRPSLPRLLLAAVLAPPLLALPFACLADVAAGTSLDLDALTLVPRSASHLAIQVALLLALALGAGLLTTLMAAAGPWPTGRGARLALAAGWLAVALACDALWPRGLLGLPLLPALALFALAAGLGATRRRWQTWLRQAPAARRAALVPLAAALGGLLLYPSLAHFGEKETRRRIERDEAPLIRRQPAWRDYALAETCRRIDAAEREGRLRLDAHDDAETLAFALWSSTDLAAFGFSSALEIQGASGALLGRFALNLPSLEAPPESLPESERWTLDRARLRLGSAEREVLHARRRLSDAGAAAGVHVFLADDFADLPFLPARDVSAALVRGAPTATAHGREIDLTVYDRASGVRFSSLERPPALTPELAARAQAAPSGFWATLAVDARPHHTFVFADAQGVYALSYPQRRAGRFAADLVEGASALALAALAALFLVVALRTLLGRGSLTLPALGAGVRRRFALRLFVAFVGVALLPLLVLQGVVAGFVRERLHRAAEDQALERASVARKAVEDFVTYQRQGHGSGSPDVTDAALVWIASLVRNDLDVFADGLLLASSKRELYASGLLPSRLPGPAYRELALEGRPLALSTEILGGLTFRVVCVPVRLGQGSTGVLRVPLAPRERELQAVLSDLERTIRLASVVFLLAGAVLAHSLARRIAGPLRDLTHATRRVAAGDLETRVETGSRDELRDLVEAFNQMAADLRRQRADLERSNRLAAWAEMARQVAHEVKNPLTPIQLSAEHLRRVWRDPRCDFGAALETCTATILRQVRSLRDIVTEFSAFARPPAGTPAVFDLGELLREVLAAYDALPPGVGLDIDVASTPAPVRGERRLLARAVVNLVENALQAVESEGRLTVRLRVDVAASRAQVEVEDDGPGVDPELHERIFEPFFSTKTGGSGLGLALVRKIAEEHDGGVALDSRPGHTCARLWLPLASGATAAEKDPSAARRRTDG